MHVILQEIIKDCICHNISTLFVLVNHLHAGVLERNLLYIFSLIYVNLFDQGVLK